MKIAIIVHGRFHAFDLARELIRSGQEVCVLTNYPKRIAARFGIPPKYIKNKLLHGIVWRVAQKIDELIDYAFFEPAMHRWFARWAAGVLKSKRFDVVHGFTGVCEEVFRALPHGSSVRMLVRGSAHIEEQFEILCEEQARTGCSAYLPGPWIREREKREYSLADLVVVLSNYAYDSFLRQGFPREKLRLLPLGAQLDLFRPDKQTVLQRSERIRRNLPLRVLTVGSFSLQKGAWDYLAIAERLRGMCEFRFVGTVLAKAKELRRRAEKDIEFVPRVPQHALPAQYAWGDLFMFLSVHDGYAVVLAQASAAALPILSTANCAGPDLIEEGKNGWIFPIRRPDLFINKLEWCDGHRKELAAMVPRSYESYVPRDWSDVAKDFVGICREACAQRSKKSENVARA